MNPFYREEEEGRKTVSVFYDASMEEELEEDDILLDLEEEEDILLNLEEEDKEVGDEVYLNRKESMDYVKGIATKLKHNSLVTGMDLYSTGAVVGTLGVYDQHDGTDYEFPIHYMVGLKNTRSLVGKKKAYLILAIDADRYSRMLRVYRKERRVTVSTAIVELRCIMPVFIAIEQDHFMYRQRNVVIKKIPLSEDSASDIILHIAQSATVEKL